MVMASPIPVIIVRSQPMPIKQTTITMVLATAAIRTTTTTASLMLLTIVRSLRTLTRLILTTTALATFVIRRLARRQIKTSARMAAGNGSTCHGGSTTREIAYSILILANNFSGHMKEVVRS